MEPKAAELFPQANLDILVTRHESIEEKQALIDQHPSVIKNIAFADLDPKLSGNVDGVAFETVFRSGKQQPVHIMKLSFPEGSSFEVVVRPTGDEYEELYSKHEVVRKYFPHIFYSTGGPTEKYRKVLLLQKIEGYEEKLNGSKFEEFVSDPEHFEQLCKDTFEMVDELYHEQLALSDIDPSRGHNVIYNTETNKFQFFDVDSIHPSDKQFEEKFMGFINRGMQMSDGQVHFLMRMIQQYFEKYTAGRLSYEGEEYKKAEYVIVEGSESELGKVIQQGDTGYEEAYRAIDWRGTMGRTGLPPLALHIQKGKDTFILNQELLEAVKENNFEKVRDIITRLGGRIVEAVFTENKK